MSVIDNWLPELLEKYGNKSGIRREDHANGQVRYRIVAIPNTPGVWISKQETFNELHTLALKDPEARNYKPTLYAYQVAAA